ncbi:TIGR04255 family protein [Pararhizobium gei]|uniref:TIGR04255 family protein n=1 Tax=Pararhizobium gei TaxID=1395951 RepID=UPI0023DA2709|nr:TIGR04255 family protein [Rhizobium gei]
MATSTRPKDLPDYKKPPLNEVVLGVQFPPVEGYQHIFAGDVWRLYKHAYPVVSENPPLPPTFETFGPPGTQQISFNIGNGTQHSRYWFLTTDKHELIQFQNDRLLHNWRKIGPAGEYPRFEVLLAKFQTELMQLSDYFRALSPTGKSLVCNQVEVTYTNHVAAGAGSNFDPSSSLQIFDFRDQSPTDMNAVYRKILTKPDGSPYARLICEVISAIDYKGDSIAILQFSVRGSPSVGTPGNVMEFMREARITIVNEFTHITSAAAHKTWERIS